MAYLLITLSIYYVLVLVVGLIRFRRQTPQEYITAPGGTGVISLTMSLLGTIVGGGMFLGIAQLGFEKGIAVFALAVSYLCGSIILGLLAPHLRKIARERGVTTLFGLIENLYPSTGRIGLASVFSWVTFFVFLLMLAVQFVGMGTFLSFYTHINFHVTIMVGATIVAGLSIPVYTALGGFKRDIYTDVVQVIFVAMGTCTIIASLAQSPTSNMLSNLPNQLTMFGSQGTVFFIGALLFVAPTFLVRFDLWQRMITAKSDGHARVAFILSGLLSFVFFVSFGIIGMYAKADGIANGRCAALEVIQRVVKGPGLGIVVAAFFAAVMSSADTFLGVCGLAFARGTIYRTGELESVDENKVSVSRLRTVTLFVGVSGIALALIFRDIIDLFASAFGLLMTFVPSFVGGLVRKKFGATECWWSILSGLAVFLPLALLIPKEAFLVAFLVSLLVYLVVSYRHRQRI